MTDAKKDEAAKSESSTSVQKSPAKKTAAAPSPAESEEKVASRLIDMEEPVTSDALNPAYAPAPEEPAEDADETDK